MSLYGPQGANYLTADSTQKFDLGSTYWDPGVEARFIYAKASAAIAQYAAAKIDHDGTAAELTTTISGVEPTEVGIPQVALSTNYYGWFFVEGSKTGAGIKVLAAASCAADVKLYTTATAGVIDDTATDLIAGLVLTVANGAAQAATECRAVCKLVTNCQD
jgi:hypothetical protein